MQLVKQVLDSFVNASGLHVNLHNSRLFTSKHIRRAKVNKFRDILGFTPTTNIGKYLGFPILIWRVKKSNFGFILDRMNLHLMGCKSNLLGRVGRVVLTSLVLNTIPNYVMQNLWLPLGVCDVIDKHTRKFIWGGHHKHWVNWNLVSTPNKKGGLGICTTMEVNVALLGKYTYDLILEKPRL